MLPQWHPEEGLGADSSAIVVSLSMISAESRFIIGRGTTADITVTDPMMSREHLELVRINDRWHARDLGSKNGCQVNNIALGDHPTPIIDGDLISAGSSVLHVQTTD